MIIGQRAYEANSRVVKAADECSLKLTTWSASAGLALALMVSATVAAAIPFETEAVERVRAAIADAVRQRMGDAANVTIDVQSIDGASGLVRCWRRQSQALARAA